MFGLDSIITVGASLLGSYMSSQANQEAADTASEGRLAATQATIAANKEARGEFREAANRGIGAIQAGTSRYAETVNPLLTPNPVGLRTYRGLTASQQIGREDLMRQGRATVAASGLRGAGRGGVAALLDSDRRFVANAADANDREQRGEMRRAQGSADSARTGLAQVYAQEGGSIANTEIGQGNNIASSLASDGRAQAAGLTSAADTQAQATTANGNLWGEAIGALGSVAANSVAKRYEAGGSI